MWKYLTGVFGVGIVLVEVMNLGDWPQIWRASLPISVGPLRLVV